MATKSKPLTERQKKADQKLWNALTTRQKKAEDPKRFERDLKAAAKAKEQALKAALKAKEQKKKEAEKAKSAKLKAAEKAKAEKEKAAKKKAEAKAKEVTKKAAKKTAKQTKAAKVKEAVSNISRRKTTQIKSTLPAEKKSKNIKSEAQPEITAQPRITTARMVNGLYSHLTYVIVAEAPKGNTDCQIGVRRVGSTFRIHAFPDFAAHGIDAPEYKHGTRRPADNGRAAYQTNHVNEAEFKGFMTKLRESASHAHIVDDLILSKLGVQMVGEAVAAAA